jgi:hypothetical protein
VKVINKYQCSSVIVVCDDDDDDNKKKKKKKNDDEVKEDEMDRACSTNGEKRNAYRILFGMPEGKRLLGRPRRRCVDNIIMDFREIGWNGMD